MKTGISDIAAISPFVGSAGRIEMPSTYGLMISMSAGAVKPPTSSCRG